MPLLTYPQRLRNQLRKGSSFFLSILKGLYGGLHCSLARLLLSACNLRGRSPAPPFPPDHRQAGEPTGGYKRAVIKKFRGLSKRGSAQLAAHRRCGPALGPDARLPGGGLAGWLAYVRTYQSTDQPRSQPARAAARRCTASRVRRRRRRRRRRRSGGGWGCGACRRGAGDLHARRAPPLGGVAS
jgi:hypothetical protein